MAIHSVNSTVGPEGLCPTLCRFGVMPRPATNTTSVNQIERARAINKAKDEVAKHHAKAELVFD